MKTIEIKPFAPLDYGTLLVVVREYIDRYQSMIGKVNNEYVYGLECHEKGFLISINGFFQPFLVKVKETGTKYIFEINYRE